jgi:glycosyltransferase involved in cell wall biosynthesis
MNGIAISIVICSYNRAAYIPLALQSMVEQTLSSNAFEVIVVDNNSTDNTTEVCNKFIATHKNYNIQYITEINQGSSYARNTGAAIAKGTLLCFMDDDAIAEKNYLQRIVDFYGKKNTGLALGGRIIPRYIPEEPKWMSYYVSSLVGNFDYAKDQVQFAEGKYPLESNMIVAKKDFDAIKGFNVALPGVKGTLRIGGEGKDFFIRLNKTGVQVYYDPTVIVEHITEVSKLTPEYMYRVASGIGRGEAVRTKAISKGTFYKKIIEYVYKFFGSVAIGLFYVIKGKPAQAMPVIQFRIDALKGLLGK